MIDPVAFTVFGRDIYWYGLLWVAAFVIALQVLKRFGPRLLGVDKVDDIVQDLWTASLIGILVGGRVGYALIYGQELLREDFWWLFRIYEGGLSFHGGLVGAIIVVLWQAHAKKLELLRVSDLVCLAGPLGLACGRLGNFINGELWGHPTDVPWAMAFPQSGDDQLRHPSQLYELAGEGLLLFALLVWLVRRGSKPGEVTAAFLICYGLIRFGLEYFRVADEHMGYFLLDLSAGQLLSVPMIALGVAVLAVSGVKQMESIEQVIASALQEPFEQRANNAPQPGRRKAKKKKRKS